MITKLKTAALSAMIGLGAIAAIPADCPGRRRLSELWQRPQRHGRRCPVRRYDRYDYRDGYRYDRRYDRACTPNRALNKAERLGLRRAYVVDVDRRTIKVAGRKYGERVRITFARTPNCPVVRW